MTLASVTRWVPALFLCLASATAHALDPDEPFGDRFLITGGGYFPHLDTVVRVDASDGSLGTTIDFESTLGMDRSEALPRIRGFYRFNDKHRLNFGYFDLNRSGRGISDAEIRFGDTTFPANLPINSFFDIEVYDLEYGYTLFDRPNYEVEFSFGLSVQEIAIGLDTLNGLLTEETDVTAPLPTFGANAGYAITDKWIASVRVGVFTIELDLDDSDIAGTIWDVNANIFHKTFEYVGFGVGYALFDVDVDYEDSKLDVSANYQYRGPMVFMAGYF